MLPRSRTNSSVLRTKESTPSPMKSSRRPVLEKAGSADRQVSRPLLQLSNPDVAETYRLARVAVCLQFDGSSVVLLVRRLTDIQRLALQFVVVLHEHAVEQDRDVCRSFDGAVRLEGRRCPDHVVGLPLAGFAARIRQRDGLFVD